MEERKPLRAQVNPNGNTKQEMMDALINAAEALREAQKAVKEIHMNVVHGRNYQTVENAQLAWSADVETISKMQEQISKDQTWLIDQVIRIYRQ